MKVLFGVDTASPVTDVVPQVQQLYGVTPSWVGRYLPGYGITADELAYLQQQHIAILCLWNGENAQSVGFGYEYGLQRGRDAASAWASIGAPRGCAIVVDVEQPWMLSHQFMTGWLDGCKDAGYVGAAYLNPIAGENHTDAWLQARASTTAPGAIFSSEPEFNAWRGVVRTDWYDFTQTPLGARGVDVCWHQYSIDEHGGLVDLDVCNAAGWALLWGGMPPPPATRTVTYPGHLKTQASHASKVAIDPHREPVWLEVGASVQPTGETANTDDHWVELKLVKPEQVVHGWYPEASLSKAQP